mmetsp:Transcript_45535/g.81926  ORF Transcript_45535/g.81926 Transcript_45535/m.81926 type:complete len:748 (-) Transcript_45535:105-2348(-)|eukprot:CAMPEP_0197639040 /NCGR_PEP_ID=MMETSP1338-20131121/13783_1 /TAXON_ID=43686 ORGANISM="Pelagodinium beii, Strain RCC1491" /NCGR_SAMPLE_ID=MMETSP1338 /ASSEMBLY_ACC=CAM_ASM_000754 /LENGTH=747 /DNA_ID=CAMNT_0043211713 /DNA_START=23 /DNA_END=2266 /DNA_ORIENTATION=-
METNQQDDERRDLEMGELKEFEDMPESDQQRFHRMNAKDSRRYEILVLAVEVCYIVIFFASYLMFMQMDEEDVMERRLQKGPGSQNHPKPQPPKHPRQKQTEFYESCVGKFDEGYITGSLADVVSNIGTSADISQHCKDTLLGTDAIGDFLQERLKVNHYVPILIVAVRVWRLYGHKLKRVLPNVLKPSQSWNRDTVFHTIALSWYGSMAGIFSLTKLSQSANDNLLNSLSIGPTLYIFVLSTLCLTVLDFGQSTIASFCSFVCFGTPTIVGAVLLQEKGLLDAQSLRALTIDEGMLVVAIAAVCYARWSSWRDKKMEFTRTEKLASTIIDEKVKRCLAEFNAQQLFHSKQAQVSDGQESSYLYGPVSPIIPDMPADRAAVMWPSPPSTASAPADLDRLGLLQKEGSPRCDCLPVSAKVHVNGNSQPKMASELEVGDQVLCYDHLVGSIKFVELADVGTVSGTCHWSRISMADGTTMSVTADHPVRVVAEVPDLSPEREVKGAFGLGGGRVSHAGDLKPGKDMLKILRLGAVPVAEMRIDVDDQPRVRVNLHQSWRYSLFCSQGAGADMTAVAIESSDALQGRAWGDIKVGNTFIQSDLSPISEEEAFVPRKPKSAPPDLGYQTDWRPDKSDRGSDRGMSSDETNVGGESDRKTAQSDESEDLHAEEKCVPCLFQARHYQNPDKFPPCTKEDCQLKNCHLQHPEEYLQRYKTFKRKYEKKNRLAHRKGAEDEKVQDDQDHLLHLTSL